MLLPITKPAVLLPVPWLPTSGHPRESRALCQGCWWGCHDPVPSTLAFSTLHVKWRSYGRQLLFKVMTEKIELDISQKEDSCNLQDLLFSMSKILSISLSLPSGWVSQSFLNVPWQQGFESVQSTSDATESYGEFNLSLGSLPLIKLYTFKSHTYGVQTEFQKYHFLVPGLQHAKNIKFQTWRAYSLLVAKTVQAEGCKHSRFPQICCSMRKKAPSIKWPCLPLWHSSSSQKDYKICGFTKHSFWAI
jgi:hypothetical protein